MFGFLDHLSWELNFCIQIHLYNTEVKFECQRRWPIVMVIRLKQVIFHISFVQAPLLLNLDKGVAVLLRSKSLNVKAISRSICKSLFLSTLTAFMCYADSAHLSKMLQYIYLVHPIQKYARKIPSMALFKAAHIGSRWTGSSW